MFRIVAVSALLCAAVLAEETPRTPAERLEELEKEMLELKKEMGKDGGAKPADAPKEAPVGGVFRRLVNRTRLGGYVDLEFYDFNGQDSFFDNHHLNLQVSSYLHDRLFVFGEVEIEHGGEAVRIEQGYLDFELTDWLTFRGGVFLQPLGRMNAMHDSDQRDLTLRPLTETLIVPTTWSDLGVGARGSFFFGPVTLNYEVYVSQGIKDEAFTVAEGLHDSGENLAPDNNHDKAASARAELVAFDGKLTFGLAGYEGNYDSKNRKRLFVYSTDLTIAIPLAKPGGWISGPLEFRIEAARFHAQPGLNADGDEVPHRGIGAYAQVSFHFFPPFLRESFLGLGFENPTFTLVGLWDAVEIDAPDGPHNNHQRRLSLGLNFRPIEQVVFKVELVRENSDEIFGNFEKRGVAASLAAGF